MFDLDSFIDSVYDFIWKEKKQCLNSRLSVSFVERTLIERMALLSRLLVSTALIPLMIHLIHLARLRVLVQMCFSSIGLLMISSSVIKFVPSITSMALV